MMRCGIMPIEKVFTRSRFLSSEYASHRISASFAASEGCTWIGPKRNQRAAPPPVCPRPTTLAIISSGDGAEDRVGERPQAVVVDARRQVDDDQGSERVQRLARQKVLRIAEDDRRFDDAGAVDHDHAEAEQEHDHRGQDDVHRTLIASV